MKAAMHRASLLLSLLLLGSGCVDVRVVASDENSVPKVGASDFVADKRLSVERRSVSTHELSIFRLLDGNVRLKLERPDRNDSKVFLSVAGTYTSPSDKPEGFIVLDGKIVQSRERQGWNGAAFFRADGTLSIFETNNGKLLTKDYLATVEKDGASLIQGHLLVEGGKAQNLAPQTPYQRRALAVMVDGSFAVIESVELLDLQVFADALVEIGVADALNLDMGQWSEGWYRNPVNGNVVLIGYLTGSTSRQSNWIVFADR